MKQCDNDADTSIVRDALSAAADDYAEVRVEDADVLVMLVNHKSNTNHSLFFTMSKGSYDIRNIRELFVKERELLALLSRILWLWYSFSNSWPWENDSVWQILYRRHWWTHETSSKTYKLLRTWWLRLVFRFSSTFITHNVLLWVQHVTTCSRGRQRLGWSN